MLSLMERDVTDKRQSTDLITDDRIKTTRHPRWTRQETFVLFVAKNCVEYQTQRAHRTGSLLGTDQNHTEPKWDTISMYCRQHGVNRTPAQCRKRWGNLLCDFRKIKTWESSSEEGESFWMMRNELRKENRLPSFFDREVYDVMDGKVLVSEAVPLAFVSARIGRPEEDGEVRGVDVDEGEEEEEEAEDVFEIGPRSSGEDGVAMDVENSGHDEVGWSSRKETFATFAAKSFREMHKFSLPISDNIQKGNPILKTRKESATGEGSKKRRLSSSECDEEDCRSRLVRVLESNNKMLNVQLAAQNLNYELDRKQRKEFNDSLVGVLNKLADAMIKIGNKL